ncbi:MAG: F0F1 ATP synthase subunit C [Deltaproteobacteria bacterium]|nr:F0F1 ATP synthase subunit C [Deltaproteobacteria bacterium]
MKKVLRTLFWSLVFVVVPALAFAADGVAGGGADLGMNSGKAIGAGIAIGAAGLGSSIGMGLTAGNTTAGIARNPGAAGAMFTNFILGMVLLESVAIYGLLIAFLLVP